MNHDSRPTPFKTGWISFRLPDVRPCHTTYCVWTDDLPPLPPVDYNGGLGWLLPLPLDLDRRMQPFRPAPDDRARSRANLQRLSAAAPQAGFELPAAFVRLMGSEQLQDRIPSCTACYFELFERLLPCPGREEDAVVPFLIDQQAVVVWYLVLRRHATPYVVASFADLVDLLAGEDPTEAQVAFVDDAVVCAWSFEEFLYRFWLENVIWFALVDGRPLTDGQRRYVDFYRRLADHRGKSTNRSG